MLKFIIKVVYFNNEHQKDEEVSCLNDCFGVTPGTGFPHVDSPTIWMHLQETALGLQASGHMLFIHDQHVRNPASCD